MMGTPSTVMRHWHRHARALATVARFAGRHATTGRLLFLLAVAEERARRRHQARRAALAYIDALGCGHVTLAAWLRPSL